MVEHQLIRNRIPPLFGGVQTMLFGVAIFRVQFSRSIKQCFTQASRSRRGIRLVSEFKLVPRQDVLIGPVVEHQSIGFVSD